MSYYAKSDRAPDFRVRYRWLSQSEAEVRQGPFQHMRCDFSYAGDDVRQTGVYMIWPEFEDSDGVRLPDSEPVPEEGTATMWIVNDAMREEVHRERVKPGVRGFFVIGSHRIAEAEITEVIALAE